MSRATSLPPNDADLVRLLLAINPDGLGGVCLRGLSGPERDAWVWGLARALPEGTPWIKVPINVGQDRLLGGLDFAATMAAGKPVFARGLLEAADGGVLSLAMAERVDAATAAIVAQALDQRVVRVERDGIADTRRARFGVVAFDEGLEDDERLPDVLAERVAFRLDSAALAEAGDVTASRAAVGSARSRLPEVVAPAEIIEALVATALSFGIDSVRAELLALETARTIAAWRDLSEIDEAAAADAARLVYAWRATRMPAEATDEEQRNDEDEPPDEQEDEARANTEDALPEDLIVDAVRAALPDGLLEALAADSGPRRAASGGRSESRTRSRRRGRPIGVKASTDLAGSRLNLLATLKAAAPWQTLRRRETVDSSRRLALRKEDLHVTRFEDNVETATIFLVDASGSQAAQRLAEVKGAIEMLLADCYVRRDHVALIAFRRDEAETLLPPTRALARVKRSLAALPGGGATPLATGLDRARELATSVSRHGRVPVIVLLTDGRANVARDGSTGSEAAGDDALKAARLLRAEGFRTLLVDTSRRPRPRARELADAMGANYVPLPFADAAKISATVRSNVA